MESHGRVWLGLCWTRAARSSEKVWYKTTSFLGHLGTRKCLQLQWMWHRFPGLMKKRTLRTGFEPARGDPKRFLISRLNHSAIAAVWFLQFQVIYTPNTASSDISLLCCTMPLWKNVSHNLWLTHSAVWHGQCQRKRCTCISRSKYERKRIFIVYAAQLK